MKRAKRWLYCCACNAKHALQTLCQPKKVGITLLFLGSYSIAQHPTAQYSTALEGS